MNAQHWEDTPVILNPAQSSCRMNAPALLLAHGAGAGMRTDFLERLARLLASNGVNVVRFDFPYMVKMTTLGKRRPPDRAPVLLETWIGVLAEARKRFGGDFILAGKSMGGRMATLMAAENPELLSSVKSIECFGYPFHPPGKPEKTRIDHFPDIEIPVNIYQGQRDKFGLPDEVLSYRLPKLVKTHWITDGDHDLRPRKSSGVSWDDNIMWVAREVSSRALQN